LVSVNEIGRKVEMSDARDSSRLAEMQEKLYSAVIADILDEFGYRHQAMSQNIRPIDPSFTLMGKAFTALAVDVYEIPENPYEKELEAVDNLSEGDILVATTNGSTSSGFWGELLSTAATSKGARGAVIDGLTRDSRQIIDMGFPVFTRGYSPLDSKGRLDVISYGTPIRCGGVEVSTGDIIFGDHDGVVVIPESVAQEVLPKALEKVEDETGMRQALQQGMGVVEAFREHKIL
jgi:4-hydroxy-4-methyl-2-oxoglutarate aldolase